MYELILKALKLKRKCGPFAARRWLENNGVTPHTAAVIIDRPGPYHPNHPDARRPTPSLPKPVCFQSNYAAERAA